MDHSAAHLEASHYSHAVVRTDTAHPSFVKGWLPGSIHVGIFLPCHPPFRRVREKGGPPSVVMGLLSGAGSNVRGLGAGRVAR